MGVVVVCPTRLPVPAASGPLCLRKRSIRVSNVRGARRAVTEAKVRSIFMPALSSTMTEGKIVQWLKSEGDSIKKGEAIVIVESDKADMDVESFYDGILAGVAVGDGESAKVGVPIAVLAEAEADLEAAKKELAGISGGADPAPAPAPAAAAAPEPAAAAPAASSAPPPPPPPAPAPAPAPAPVVAVASPQPRADGRIIATPYAKKLAKQLKVDLTAVGGSGLNGRITAADVERVSGVATVAPPSSPSSSNGSAPPAPAPVAASAAVSQAPAPSTPPPQVKAGFTPFSGLQKAVAANMNATVTTPTIHVSQKIITDKFDSFYKTLKPKGVTMTALLAKAVAVALAKHPVINAGASDEGFYYNESVNVAVAVAMNDGGLITPVLKNASVTDIYQLSRDWADLVKRARGKKLTPDEYSGGTFTVSNLGTMAIPQFDAILPSGQGGILAVGASLPTVVAGDDGSIKVVKQMIVNITADHRTIYGADAADFLNTLKALIENPESLATM